MTTTLPEVPMHLLRQTWRWMRAPFDFLDECHARYGDFFVMHIVAFGRVHVLSDPDAIRDLFAQGYDDVLAGESNRVLRPFLGRHSVLLLDGKEHQRQRQLLLPPFHGERLRAYGQTMLDLAQAAIDTWPLHRPFRLHRAMQAITMRIILRTVFGMDEGAQMQRIMDLLTRTLDVAASPIILWPAFQKDLGPLSPWGRFVRLVAEGDRMLYAEIAARREREGGSDVLSLLLAARDEDGQPMTDVEIRDELLTLLVAGHETTATALCWAMRWLLADAPLLRRLQDEVAGAAQDGALVPERVARLELLDATVREALRLQPVIPLVARILRRPMRILGHDLPAGAVIAPSIYLAQRRAPAFPDAARFDPERFLRSRPSASEWFPFGGGMRRCIGAAFAQHEMKMVLAAVLSRARLRLATERVRVVRRSITLTPSAGLPVVMEERRRIDEAPRHRHIAQTAQKEV